MDRRRFIHASRDSREFISKAFGCTVSAVNKALAYSWVGGNSDKIRHLALQRGGILMNELLEVETFHDHDDVMTQYLPNGAMLEFDKSDGSGRVYCCCSTYKGSRKIRTHN